MRGAAALVLIAVSAPCLAAGVSAQDTCDLLSSRSSTVRVTRDAVHNYISQPVFGCDGGVLIRADSAELNDAMGYTRFIGNFEYRDPTAVMTADRADHFAAAGRLIGVGNVHITDGATGAVFEGDSTVLVGSSSRRADGELTIVGRDGRRAHAVILVSPRAAAPDTSEVVADSAAVVEDSVAAAPDSVAAAPGSAGAAVDSTAAIPDSTGAVAADSALVAGPGEADPESAQAVPPDSAAALSDSASVAAGPPATPDPPPQDTTPVPYDIDAEHIYLRGAGYLLATGNAEVYNDEFRALGDSIEYREEAGKLLLRGTAPRVYGFGAEYVLSGEAVDMDMDGNQVAARGDAALSGSEIDLTAPEIRVLTRDGALDQIVAMSERPPEPEPPGAEDETGGLPADSATMVAAGAGEAAGDAAPPVGDPGAAAAAGAGEAGDAPPGATEDETATGATPAEPALRDAASLPVAVAGGGAGVGEAGAGETDTGGTGAGQTAGEPGDSAAIQPPARPRAVAEAFELEGDSINVVAPGEVLERVIAVGGARGESLARDSLNTENTPEIARSDWVLGDTITAVFRPVASGETPPEAGTEPAAGPPGGGYQLDRLVASGQAASLYRMTPTDGGEENAGEDEGNTNQDTGARGDAAGEEADAGGDAAEGQTDAAPGAEAAPAPGEEIPLQQADPAAGEATPAEQADPAAQAPAEEVARADPAGPDADPQSTGPGTGEAAAADDPPDNRLALHYVRGDLITIFMEGGEVTSVIVEGDARGIQLEPVAPPPPDSTAAAPPPTRR